MRLQQALLPPACSSRDTAPPSGGGGGKNRPSLSAYRPLLFDFSPSIIILVSSGGHLSRRSKPQESFRMAGEKQFRPALIIVDFQEDFCPPNGALPVTEGRSIASSINTLTTLPFALILATKDFHPPNHISFAANHPSATPYTSTTTVVHPRDPDRSYETTLWPTHCVQGTQGADLVPELDVSRVHAVIEKGQDARVEMYSAFYDPFRVSDSGLAAMLKEQEVTDVYVVGLAGDFCVKATAEHAVDEGYQTWIVEEGTKPVMPDKWDECRREMKDKGIKFTPMDGEAVARVKTCT
ncbi:pyrazinamidase nicotinamidase [Fusarium albosuccineum]|uniref:nicotinamidase n=1 Tax=Fusarium albosuccineum TaxID=1237068 RepID=A0A8H4K982_9HYPO|nr:pyrazinamidase nicotinamidase [Fusarium albosuccineum]